VVVSLQMILLGLLAELSVHLRRGTEAQQPEAERT